jgi:hypothetical protein
MRSILLLVLLSLIICGCGSKANQGIDKPANPAPAPTSTPVTN